MDRRQDHRAAPIRSRMAAARAELRLPAVTSRAARRLRNRRHYVSVAEATDKAEPSPSSVLEYVGKVANILTQTTYHFPQCGLQVTNYLSWLLSRSAGRTLREVQAADSRARQAMALRPRDFLTTLDLDQFLPTGQQLSRSLQTGAGSTGRGAQTCFRFLRRNDCGTPCQWGRVHPPCSVCSSPQHPTEFHGAAQNATRQQRPADQFGRAPAGRGAMRQWPT